MRAGGIITSECEGQTPQWGERNSMPYYSFVVAVCGTERTRDRFRDAIRKVVSLYDCKIGQDGAPIPDSFVESWPSRLEAPHDERWGGDDEPVFYGEDLLSDADRAQ